MLLSVSVRHTVSVMTFGFVWRFKGP
uniref:Uncharacterized protein n=1 Tax=Arundo donax TaxID=35708 RepID=A0A0A9HM31_ARUDO